MKQLNTKVLVSDLVAQRPSRSRLFEQLGIEYCCGGKRPLDEVCNEKGLDARTLLDTLFAAESGGSGGEDERNWTHASIQELIQNITDVHHAYLRQELPRLSALADHVAESHGEREPRLLLLRECLTELREELEPHLDREEAELFRAILNLMSAPVAAKAENPASAAKARSLLHAALESLEGEHRQTAEKLQRIRALSDRFEAPDWACNSFRAFYDGLHELETNIHEHVHKENNILFPAVKEAITEELAHS